MDVLEFQNQIHGYILDTMDDARAYQYNDNDLKEINMLRESKFSSWEWNFGYSPKYQFNKKLQFRRGEVALRMNVAKGIIREVNIEGDFLGSKDIHVLEEVLVGTIHDPETIRMRLSGIQVDDYIAGLENEDLLSGMF